MSSSANCGGGEFRTAAPLAGLILVNTSPQIRQVRFSPIDGMGIFEGDIILGAETKLRSDMTLEGIVLTGSQFRWLEGIVVYRIDPRLANPQRVHDAIEHWQDRTRIRFRERTDEPDFVTFRNGTGCSSSVGRRGGEQVITLGLECSTGNAIHEIGHTVGLWHEQSREDRKEFIEIDETNIEESAIHNFNQHINDGDDIGDYDYGSIMHYPANAFAKDPSRPTIITPNGQAIGQRIGLSAGDIAAVHAIYPK